MALFPRPLSTSSAHCGQPCVDVRVERGAEQPLRTVAILTASFSPIGGPPAIGQSYEVVELEGVARFVEP